jgi:hypothetical protein
MQHHNHDKTTRLHSIGVFIDLLGIFCFFSSASTVPKASKKLPKVYFLLHPRLLTVSSTAGSLKLNWALLLLPPVLPCLPTGATTLYRLM